MIARSFYFLRHGETDANANKILQGRMDTELNENGLAQARHAIDFLKQQPIDRIIASPLKRAARTAEIVNEVLGKPMIFADDLMERHMGVFQGMTHDVINQWRIDHHLHEVEHVHTGTKASVPQGESYDDFRLRVIKCIADNTQRYAGENILFVGHNGFFKMLSTQLFGQLMETRNASPYHFELKDNQWCLNCLVTQYEKDNAT